MDIHEKIMDKEIMSMTKEDIVKHYKRKVSYWGWVAVGIWAVLCIGVFMGLVMFQNGISDNTVQHQYHKETMAEYICDMNDDEYWSYTAYKDKDVKVDCMNHTIHIKHQE